MNLNKEHFKVIEYCPWCGEKKFEMLYRSEYEIPVNRCNACGFVYSEKILNEAGMQVYWENYESNVHMIDKDKNLKRKEMYRVESEYIKKYFEVRGSEILDVGCASGDFLDCFSSDGAICEGVEYGQEAAIIAAEKYNVYCGEFPKLGIKKQYDLIIFRGTIQYFTNPKEYFKKAVNLLKDNGFLYITSSPNTDSICFRLFKEKFNLPVCVTDYYGYSEKLITEYMSQLGCRLVNKHNFYLETPYASPEEDILKVAKAIELHKCGKAIDFIAPAFFDNMLTLIYKK